MLQSGTLFFFFGVMLDAGFVLKILSLEKLGNALFTISDADDIDSNDKVDG
jgi:hypothetical protein